MEATPEMITNLKCKNCRAQLLEPDYYCSNCGGKVIRNRLTLRNLFHHVSETFFNPDNKLLRTFLALFSKPEDVIVGYINGTRKKYVDVLAYFTLALTLSGLQIFVMQKVGLDTTFYDTSTQEGKAQQKIFDEIYSFATEYQSLVVMSYVPLYALLAKVVFRKYKKFNFTELLVVFLYGQAHISISSAILTTMVVLTPFFSFQVFSTVLLPLQLVYFIYCLKRTYTLTLRQILVRTFVFLLIVAVLFVVFSILSALVMYKLGLFEQMKN